MTDEEFDTEGVVKKFMFLNRKPPYGTVYALEVLETVLISAAFDQDTCMAFVDDGVYQIMKGSDTTESNMKNFTKTYRALEGYDIEKLYVEKESMEARGLTEDDFIVDEVIVVDAEAMTKIIAEQDVVISG